MTLYLPSTWPQWVISKSYCRDDLSVVRLLKTHLQKTLIKMQPWLEKPIQLKPNRKSNEPCQICAAYFSTENELKNRRSQIVQALKLIFTNAALICFKPFELWAEKSSSSCTDYFCVVAFTRNPIGIVTFITEAAPCPWTLLVIISLLIKTLRLQALSTTSATKTSIPLVMNSPSRQQWSSLSYQPQQ